MSEFHSCKEFDKARQSGTDNEAYGALLWNITEGEWLIGSGLEPIVFCPWCGEKLC